MMDSIIRELDSYKGKISYEDSFRYAVCCSKALNDSKQKAREKARTFLTFVLDRLDDFPQETCSIWSDLIEAAGFYPYINTEKEIVIDSLSDRIRAYYHESKYLPEKILHTE